MSESAPAAANAAKFFKKHKCFGIRTQNLAAGSGRRTPAADPRLFRGVNTIAFSDRFFELAVTQGQS